MSTDALSNGGPAPSTSGNGAVAPSDRNSLTVGSDGPILLHDVHFIEQMAHFNRERVPERNVHAKGSGAFGTFISLELVLDALIGVTDPDGDLVLMVKPQFEVGKGRVGKGGVVRDPDLRAGAVASVARAAARRGWGARAVSTSALPGPSGNVEYFLWCRRGGAEIDEVRIADEVRRTASLGESSEKVEP